MCKWIFFLALEALCYKSRGVNSLVFSTSSNCAGCLLNCNSLMIATHAKQS